MRIPSHSVVLGAILVASAATADAAPLPQTAGSNVVISNCNLQPRNNLVESNFRVTPYASSLRSTLTVDYRNEGAAKMSAVIFGVVSDGRLVAIGQDSGRFSPGVEIRHDLVLTGPTQPTNHPQCIVLRVLYENGTAWFITHSPPVSP